MANVLVPIADGSEEMEAVIIVDVLRRAKWNVVTAGVTGKTITASRGVCMVADEVWSDVSPQDYDVLLLPGGVGGTQAMAADESLLEAVRAFAEDGRLIGAICAAPLVLQAAGVLQGRRATCHPSVAGDLTVPEVLSERVVVDGRIVTSQGPGTAFEFALKILELVDGPEAARSVAAGLVLA